MTDTPAFQAPPLSAVCIRCKHAEFPANEQPICKSPQKQRTATEHPIYGHKCYREFDGGEAKYYDSPHPTCWFLNFLGNCDGFLEKQK